jgi:hypothetical protein
MSHGEDTISNALGEEESKELKEDFKNASPEEGDGMILTLITQGYSHIQIRALFGVGGYRVNRLQKHHNSMQDPDYVPTESTKVVPKHSASHIDKARVRDHIRDTYDLEEGYACAHRNQMLYIANETVQWKDIYVSYTKSIPQGGRILSRNRWREYIRHFYPHLRLHRTEGDLCNACFRIDTSLKDPNLDESSRSQLVAEKTTHRGEYHYNHYDDDNNDDNER